MAATSFLNVSFTQLLCRIRAEYRDMPGLRLTAAQAECLFGLDSDTWNAVVTVLLDARFLSRTHNGQFALAA